MPGDLFSEALEDPSGASVLIHTGVDINRLLTIRNPSSGILHSELK